MTSECLPRARGQRANTSALDAILRLWPAGDAAYFDRVTFPGHGFCLPRIPFVLIAKSGFDGASPTRVAFVDARDERLASLRFSRQGLLEHLYDVARRQQLQARLLGHALFYYEQHRQHHHRDVVMPWPPSQRLIIGETALAFGVFESALDPVALPLHLGQSEPRRIGGGVREAVFDRLDRSNLAPDDQMPASCSLFLAVPDPDPAGRDVNPQLSARAVAQDAARPVLGRDALGQFLDGDGRRCGLLLLRRTPAARLGGGNMESRLLRPDVLVAMHVGDESLVLVVQSPQKVRLLAITAVDAHPRKPNSSGARPAHDVEREFALRHLLARGLGNPRPLAARRVLDPALRQIEPRIDRRVALAIGQHPEHRDLTIVDLAQPPRPLPGDADRTIALLGKAALVDDQRARRLAAQKTIRVLADLRHHRLVVPRRAATLNHRGHRLERAILGLRQSAQVSARHRDVVPRAGAKEMTMAVEEHLERHGDSLHQRSGQPSSKHTVT